MPHTKWTVATMAIFIQLAASPSGADPGLAGEWVGGMRLQSDWQFITVRLSQDATRQQITGTLDLPGVSPRSVPIERIRPRRAGISFELPTTDGAYTFDGTVRGNRMSGRVRTIGLLGSFELRRVLPVSVQHLQRFAGEYELEPGRIILITATETGLWYLDFGSNRIGRLYQDSDRTFFGGPGVVSGYPVEISMAFPEDRDDGAVTALRWHEKGQPARRALRVHVHREEPVSIDASVPLAGTLFLPASQGPHPAVVLIGGSAPISSAYLRPYASFYARHGVAALIVDKRGIGQSAGHFARASFADLAADALAAVHLLQAREDVDADRVGLHGSSMGGWVAPLAASRSADVAFLILEAAPTIAPAEHELARVERTMRADGFPPSTVARALRYMTLKHEVARTGHGWERLARLEPEGVREGWIGYVNRPSSLEHLQWSWTHILSHDPVPILQRVKCPVLAIYGERDTIVAPAVNRNNLETALAAAGNRDVQIVVVPGANHHFLAARTGGIRELPLLSHFAHGYFETRLGWLQARLDPARFVEPVGSLGMRRDPARLAIEHHEETDATLAAARPDLEGFGVPVGPLEAQAMTACADLGLPAWAYGPLWSGPAPSAWGVHPCISSSPPRHP